MRRGKRRQIKGSTEAATKPLTCTVGLRPANRESTDCSEE